MMRVVLILIHCLISSLVYASEPIHFKQALVGKINWTAYGMVMMFLVLAIVYVSKKYKPKSPDKTLCHVIEKTYLGNKTVVYVIDYQEQRFLLADNQQALSFYAVSPDVSDAT